MTNLATFLRARLAEHRAIAEAASPWPWKINPDDPEEVLAHDDILVADVFALSGNQTRNTATFIAVNDPAAALADLDAKLAIVDLMDRTLRFAEGDSEADHYGALDNAEEVLCHLARPFAGHPDYQEDWAA
jgi:beta-xylosidase